jgi:hypothetical protein
VSTATSAEKKTRFQVIYNGVSLAFDYKPNKHTDVLYKEVFRKFNVPKHEQSNLVLYLPDNTTEVPRSGTQAEARIRPDTTLILRPRQAGAGCS